MRYLLALLCTLLVSAPARAQSVAVDRWTPALATVQERRAADVASWATVLTAMALDTKASWDAPDRTRAIEQQALRTLVVFGGALLVKTVVHRDRPCAPACGIDHARESFFSAHAAAAFSTRQWSFAITTGGLRVAAGKHWLTDVLVGAGVGALTSRIQ